MRKITFYFLLAITFSICVSCSDSTTNSNNDFGLPNEFPLEEGNAWIYERTSYENGLRDSTILDTLYITGRFEDYYLYTWSPTEYLAMVKNIDDKLVCYGTINNYNSTIDTFFYDFPSIWAFYGETGYIDSSYFENYYYNEEDSLYISIVEYLEFFDKIYETYVAQNTINSSWYYRRDAYINKLGFARWEYFDEANNLIESTEMIEILDDFYPSAVLTNTNPTTLRTNYSQDGILLDK